MTNTIIVHLPSNSPDYPENTSNKYRVHLGRTLHFPGEWVCGLHSIIYPYTWPSISTLDDQFIRIHYDKDKILHLEVGKSSVDNIDRLVTFLDATLNEHKKKMHKIFVERRSMAEPPRKRRRRENSVTPPPDSPIVDRTPPPDTPDVTPPPSDSEEKSDEELPQKTNSTLIQQSTPQPSITPQQSSNQTPIQSSTNAPVQESPRLNSSSSKAKSNQDSRKEENEGVDFQKTIAGSEMETPKKDQKEITNKTDISGKQKKEQQPQQSNSSKSIQQQSTNQSSVAPTQPTIQAPIIQSQTNQNLAPQDSSQLNSSTPIPSAPQPTQQQQQQPIQKPVQSLSSTNTSLSTRQESAAPQTNSTKPEGSSKQNDRMLKDEGGDGGGVDFQETFTESELAPESSHQETKKTEQNENSNNDGVDFQETFTEPEIPESNQQGKGETKKSNNDGVDFQENIVESESGEELVDEEEEESGQEDVDFQESIVGPTGTLLSDLLSEVEDDDLEPYLTKMFGSIQQYIDYERIKKILESVTFFYHPRFERFVLYLNDPKISHIELSEQLAYILGFEYRQDIRHNEFAKYGVDLKGGFTSFAVYANGLTTNMIIGNSVNSLLRIVSIGGAKQGDIVEKIYDSPLYCQVLPKEVDEIEIEIKTMDNNRLVPFQYGNVMIVLIFKKVINF